MNNYWYDYGLYSLLFSMGLNILTLFGLLLNRFINKYIIIVSGINLFLVSFSFFMLIYSFIITDLSVINIVNNSHSELPVIYKIASAWGNHEGSMLLWLWIMTIMIASFEIQVRDKPFKSYHLIIKLYTFLIIFFYTFLLHTSNPYLKSALIFNNGQELSPILQDLLLVIHPPIMYAGYIATAVPFVVGLCIFNIENYQIYSYIEKIKYWTFISFIFLTIGIILGSWWAYFELGWGGWWFWDPVENASLMPWLSSLLLLHYNLYKKQQLVSNILYKNILFLPFLMSLIGTFMVRSGFLESVHSFAEDINRGVWFLSYIMCILTYIIFLNFKWYSKSIKNYFNDWSYKSINVTTINIYAVFFILLVVIVGTFYPLLHKSIYNEGVTVGFSFFHNMINPLLIAIIYSLNLYICMRSFRSSNVYSFLLASYSGALAYAFYTKPDITLSIMVCAIIFILTNVGSVLMNYKKEKRIIVSDIAHIGFILFIFSICLYVGYRQEYTTILHLGNNFNILPFNITVIDYNYGENINYTSGSLVNTIDFYDKNEFVFSEKRYYFLQDFYSSKPYVLSTWVEDLYSILGDGNVLEGWEYKIHRNSGMFILWMSGILVVTSVILRLVLNKVDYK